MLPFGPHPLSMPFSAAADVTGSRSLNTSITNGARRRLALVSLVCTAVVTGQALCGFTTVCAGQALTMAAVAGLPAGVALVERVQLFVPVDPGAAYSVTSSVTGTGTVTIQQWVEVDE